MRPSRAGRVLPAMQGRIAGRVLRLLRLPGSRWTAWSGTGIDGDVIRMLGFYFNRKGCKKMRIVICLLLLSLGAVSLSGCARDAEYVMKMNELQKTIKLEEYGPRPPENHRTVERAVLLSHLSDPDSAKFAKWTDGDPWIIPQSDYSVTPLPVWVVTVDVDSKNTYGGYGGFERWMLAWSNNKLVAVGTPEKGGHLPTDRWEYVK